MMKLVKEESIPERNDRGVRNSEIMSLLDEFINSDMDIASVHAGDRYESRLQYNKISHYVYTYYRDLIKINKRGNKIYLSKINKED